MTPTSDVTTFSAMFTEMAYQWAHTRRGRTSAPQPLIDAESHTDDEARIRIAMEAALERRRRQRERSKAGSRRKRRSGSV